jgi:hypothetical protein
MGDCMYRLIKLVIVWYIHHQGNAIVVYPSVISEISL